MHQYQHVFWSRTNRVKDALVDNVGQQSLLLHLHKTVGGIKTLFHKFFRQAALLEQKSLSCTVSSYIFNKEKHTGQNTVDLKCRYEGS